MVDDFKIDLPKNRDEWVIYSDKQNWINVMKIEIMITKFTILILFKPDVQRIISSLSFSSFNIVNIEAIKNEKGINFVIILGIVKKE